MRAEFKIIEKRQAIGKVKAETGYLKRLIKFIKMP